MGDPTPGKAGATYRIIKQDDPNFATPTQAGGAVEEIRQGYAIGPDMKPTYGMPSGPGFAPGDPAIALAGGKRRKHRKTRTFPRGILKKTAKIVPSRNPTKAPAGTKKRKVHLVSDAKIKEMRKTAKQKAIHTDLKTIRSTLIEKKIISPDKKNIPPAVLRTLYADAVGAGLLN